MEEFFGVATDGMDEVLSFTATAAAAIIGIALAIKGALNAKRFAAMSGPGGYDEYAADYAEWAYHAEITRLEDQAWIDADDEP